MESELLILSHVDAGDKIRLTGYNKKQKNRSKAKQPAMDKETTNEGVE